MGDTAAVLAAFEQATRRFTELIATVQTVIPGITASLAPAPTVEMNLDHLRGLPKATQPQAGDLAAYEAKVSDLIEELCDPDLPEDAPKVITAMLSFSKDGYCNATQTKIAAKAKVSKATVQRILNDLQERGVMRRWSFPARSDVSLFADGMRDALRRKKILKLRTHKRRTPKVERTFSIPPKLELMLFGKSPVAQGVASQNPGSPESAFPLNPESKIPKESNITLLATQELVIEDASRLNPSLSSPPSFSILCTNTSSPRAHAHEGARAHEETQNETKTTAEKARDDAAFTEKETTKEDVKRSESSMESKRQAQHVGKVDGSMKEEMTAPPAVVARTEQTKPPKETPETVMVSVLESEGVSPSQARHLVRTYSLERIERNRALGMHEDAANPGAYLRAAIIDDFARTQHGGRGNRRGTFSSGISGYTAGSVAAKIVVHGNEPPEARDSTDAPFSGFYPQRFPDKFGRMPGSVATSTAKPVVKGSESPARCDEVATPSPGVDSRNSPPQKPGKPVISGSDARETAGPDDVEVMAPALKPEKPESRDSGAAKAPPAPEPRPWIHPGIERFLKLTEAEMDAEEAKAWPVMLIEKHMAKYRDGEPMPRHVEAKFKTLIVSQLRRRDEPQIPFGFDILGAIDEARKIPISSPESESYSGVGPAPSTC